MIFINHELNYSRYETLYIKDFIDTFPHLNRRNLRATVDKIYQIPIFTGMDGIIMIVEISILAYSVHCYKVQFYGNYSQNRNWTWNVYKRNMKPPALIQWHRGTIKSDPDPHYKKARVKGSRVMVTFCAQSVSNCILFAHFVTRFGHKNGHISGDTNK